MEALQLQTNDFNETEDGAFSREALSKPPYEDEITELLLSGGLDDAGRAAFCSGTRKDCRGDAVEEAAKRQGIADLLAGISDDPPAAPAKRRKRRKKKKKPVAAEL